MFSPPLAYFQAFDPQVSQTALQALFANAPERHYAKGSILTLEGQVQRSLLWVEEGIQMAYLNQEGRLHVLAFTYPPSWSGIPDSFFSQAPSKYNLQALTTTRVREVPFEVLTQAFITYPSLERLFRKTTEAILTGFIDRYVTLHAMTMEERFRAFIHRSPHLLQKVPHKHLANYLNIDPTNFSKLYNTIRL